MPRIAIVGGGPAGSAFALHALRAGVAPTDLVIFDRARFPRPKLCGGALTWRGTELVREVAPDLVPNEAARMQTTHLRFRSQRGDFEVRERGPQWLYDRAHLDDRLLAAARDAGVEVREGCAVKAVEPAADGARVRTKGGAERFEWVVGADGARGVVARSLDLPRGIVGRLVEAVYEPLAGTEVDPSELLFDFDPILDGIPGYAWVFPYPKPTVTGDPATETEPGLYKLGIMDGRGVAEGQALRRWTDAFAERRGFRRVDAKIAGWPEHYYSHRTRAHVEGVLLTGEAWGIDPLLGEGIAPAIELSRYAAGRLKEALDRGSRRIRGYEKGFAKTVPGRNLRFQQRLADLLYGPNPRRWLDVLFSHRKMLALAAAGTEAYGRLEKHTWSLIGSYLWQLLTGGMRPRPQLSAGGG